MSGMLKRVLIVDDESEPRRLLVEGLNDGGHGLLEAAIGEEALRVFTATPCPVVTLDLVRGDLGGLKALETTRAMRPETRIISWGEIRGSIERR